MKHFLTIVKNSRNFVAPIISIQVRELIKRKLRITRDIPFNRVCRVFHGPEFRGQKPVQVRWGVKTMV